jgi:hypothetical protein
MCVFAYSSRTEIPICTKLSMLIYWDQEETIGGSKLRKSVLCSIPSEGVSVARKLSTIEEWRLNQSCLFRKGDYRNKDQNSEKLSWVRFPMKMVSVARILSTTEEQLQDKSCLFRRGNYRENVTTPKIVLGLSPDEEIYVAPKLSTREERRQGKICLFRRGDCRNQGHKPEKCPGFESRWRFWVYG